MPSKRLFTSESVTEGHPDKLCDQIADAVLDAVLTQDPTAHVACEACATTGMVLVMGELSTECYVDIPAIARRTIKEIGYNGAHSSFDYKTCAVLTAIDDQSPDIAMGVDNALENRQNPGDRLDLVGAGDQGMMFGFACRETPELMPAPISFAHSVTRRLAFVRHQGADMLLPDGKAQVTVEYDGFTPARIDAVVVSSQHSECADIDALRKLIVDEVIRAALPAALLDEKTRFYINPTGRFVIGGPQGDSGLTGRKIIVDSYGGYSRHGGGSFSGKDPTKVDRSGAYMARYVAKNIVAAGLAERCELELAYAIGVARPVSVFVDTFGTGVLSDIELTNIVRERFDLRPAAIIETLGLRRPIYRQTASYGHMGREDLGVSWEKTDRVGELKAYLK